MTHWLAPTILGNLKWDVDVVDEMSDPSEGCKVKNFGLFRFLRIAKMYKTVYIRLIHKMTRLRGTGPQFWQNW